MTELARQKTPRTMGLADPWPVNQDPYVVVIDPDAETREFYRLCLARAGIRAEGTSDGLPALRLIEESQPKAVIVDGAVGSEEVLSWARHLKANPFTSDIPVLLVIDVAEPALAGRIDASVDECLAKPVRDWELQLRVRSMLRLREYRLELVRNRGLHGEQTRVWEVLLDFSRSAVRITREQVLLDRIVRTAAEMTSSRRISLMLPDANEQHLTIAKAIGLDDDLVRRVRVPIGEAVSGRAFRSGRPVTEIEHTNPLARRRGFKFTSFVSMPMTYTTMNMVHQRVGVLNIADRYGDRPFEEWELEFIDLLGSIAGSAIDEIHSRETRESLLRMERDLEVAREIQQKTFPSDLPRLAGFEVSAWSQPAERTAGDTYDVIGFSRNGSGPPRLLAAGEADRALLLLADATGHGIGPALSVTQVRAMLRMAVRMEPEISKIARHLNEQLCADLPAGRFVTAWLGELDAGSSTLTSFSAGQGPIVHYSAAGGSFDLRPADTMPFGIATWDVAISHPIAMAPGDILAVFSDGILEATDDSHRQFGIERAMEVLSAHCDAAPDEIHKALRTAVTVFTGGEPPNDDRTAILVKRTGDGR